MLKPIPNFRDYRQVSQPPSGGCVLKLRVEIAAREVLEPAAFRRLCVETADWKTSPMRVSPAAFRRLCVETEDALYGRGHFGASRLQAAVC